MSKATLLLSSSLGTPGFQAVTSFPCLPICSIPGEVTIGSLDGSGAATQLFAFDLLIFVAAKDSSKLGHLSSLFLLAAMQAASALCEMQATSSHLLGFPAPKERQVCTFVPGCYFMKFGVLRTLRNDSHPLLCRLRQTHREMPLLQVQGHYRQVQG